ncbi:MAG: hypothetical protein H7Y07_00750 [Pyrinomonadaceae bacterium]|nr:hypothetical protein [Sphingobacteriaceae bacterium]
MPVYFALQDELNVNLKTNIRYILKLRTLFYYLLTCFWIIIFSNCSKVSADKLYGEWKYIKVENLDKNNPDSVSAADLKTDHPSISFTKTHKLQINWGGKVLSHGTFKIDDRMIRYTEILEDNRTREFPFLIKELSDTLLIFETMAASSTRVTAVKSSK